METIIGRETECKRLDECIQAKTAQLVVVYGRRRIGKTYLVNHYFKDNIVFKVTALMVNQKKFSLEIFLMN